MVKKTLVKKLDFERFEIVKSFVNAKTGLNISNHNKLKIFPGKDENYCIEGELNPAKKGVHITFWFQENRNDFYFHVDHFGIQEGAEGSRLVLFYYEYKPGRKDNGCVIHLVVLTKTGVSFQPLGSGDEKLQVRMDHLLDLSKFMSGFAEEALGEIACEIINNTHDFGMDYDATKKGIEDKFDSYGVGWETDILHILALVKQDLPEEWWGRLENYFLKELSE